VLFLLTGQLQTLAQPPHPFWTPRREHFPDIDEWLADCLEEDPSDGEGSAGSASEEQDTSFRWNIDQLAHLLPANIESETAQAGEFDLER
jgi:hypothetical protein